MNRGCSVAAAVLLGLVLVVGGGLLGVILLAHIVGRTKIVHPGWWPVHDDRPR